MISVDELNQQFGIKGILVFKKLGEGMIEAGVAMEQCSARVSMQGAQVLEWTPAGQKPVVWLSSGSNFRKGKSVRGGVPVCWPWFGAHETESNFPAHGYARTVDWELLHTGVSDSGAVQLSFRIIEDEKTAKLWPFNTPLELSISLGKTLELELVTKNQSSDAVQISEALHTYFAVSDIDKVSVDGLDRVDYLDKVQNFTRLTQQGEIRFDQEVDRVYLDTESECLIKDAGWHRQIHISKQGSLSTVVWNPWQEKADAMGDMGKDGFRHMLCVESANAADNLVTIPPGAEHRLRVEYYLG